MTTLGIIISVTDTNSHGIQGRSIRYLNSTLKFSTQVEDVVEFLGEVEDGWWRGMVGGRTGVFPSNFVEMLNNTEKKLAGNGAHPQQLDPLKASRVETKNKRNENLKGTRNVPDL